MPPKKRRVVSYVRPKKAPARELTLRVDAAPGTLLELARVGDVATIVLRSDVRAAVALLPYQGLADSARALLRYVAPAREDNLLSPGLLALVQGLEAALEEIARVEKGA